MVERGGVRHTQTPVSYQGEDIEVDVAILPLLNAMWKVGYETYGSCENLRHGMSVVWFNTGDDEGAQRFRDTLDGLWHSDLPGSRPCVGFLSDDLVEVTRRVSRRRRARR